MTVLCTSLLAACSADSEPAGFQSASGGAAGIGGGAAGQGATGGIAGASGTAGVSGAAGTGGSPPVDAGCQPVPPPACDAPPPDPGPTRAWSDPLSFVIVAAGFPNHRGRDLFLNPGDPQWIIGKFAYGLTDKDLKGEEVDIYLLRDCGSAWESLGTAVTTQEDEHPAVEGVDDSGGRVFFQIPSGKTLGPGRHRVHLVVAGDHSVAELFIEVVEPGTPLFVADVDGTLTTNETEEFTALLTGVVPMVRTDAPAVMQTLVQKGYRPFYLTARPEFLVGRTREFLATHAFPPGIVHTTLELGALGSAAVAYKLGELDAIAARGLVPTFGFGNSDSDADAYFQAGIQPDANRIFMQFTDAAHGGRRIEQYTELLPEVAALPTVCP